MALIRIQTSIPRAAVVVVVALTWVASVSPATQVAPRPARVLWAWERPEDLRAIDARTTGVAYLALTATLTGDRVEVVPRRQPLRVASDVWLSAVTRVELDTSSRPALIAPQREALVDAVVRHTPIDRVAAVQIDFDATQSERAFYRSLLHDLRKALPSRIALSMTALASWCLADNWLDDLPIDEAVPMVFRIGDADRFTVRRAAERGRFRAAACATSLGTSTDEALERYPRGRRIYVFHPRSWTSTDLARLEIMDP
jgi:hypothetical protein